MRLSAMADIKQFQKVKPNNTGSYLKHLQI